MDQQIPLLDLGPEIDALGGEILEAMGEVVRSGQFILGPNVEAFEREMADDLGVTHAIGVNSGTDALVIALRALGVGPGDEVITTPFTFFATAEAISQVGATPVFVDIERDTLNLDVSLVEGALTQRSKAIIPVHLFGHAVDLDPLLELAEARELRVLEDVAQATGGTYQDRKLGAIGDAGAFSFFPSKNLGAYGDGGLVTTNDDEVARLSRMLRFHGCETKYHNEMLGYNSRLDEMQAAVLRVKLRHLDANNEGRRAVAKRYAELFADVDGVSVPTEKAYARHVYHQYTVRIGDGKRDEVQQRLQKEGIASAVYYPVPCHRLPVYEARGVSCPLAEAAAAEVLSLPVWPQLDGDQQRRVVAVIREALS